ncbi:MAG: hypothetical protein FJZ01_17760 [Candidatus Sericytochromatia bacterium]|nr:hypothetical protein [Candidatus Tanganyikabacteria bacterium]
MPYRTGLLALAALGALAAPAHAALTGQTTDTRYLGTPKAHILKDGYHEFALSPFGLSTIVGLAERTELGVALGGHATWYTSGVLPPGYTIYPGFSAGLFAKHLLWNTETMGLAIALTGGGLGLFSVAGPITPVSLLLPFSWDLGPRNTLTVSPGGGAAWHQGQMQPTGGVSLAYEWRFSPTMSFLLLDDAALVPKLDNRVAAGFKLRAGGQEGEVSVSHALARLSGPALVLDYGILDPDVKWVGPAPGR